MWCKKLWCKIQSVLQWGNSANEMASPRVVVVQETMMQDSVNVAMVGSIAGSVGVNQNKIRTLKYLDKLEMIQNPFSE